MQTIPAIVKNGAVVTPKPLDASDDTRCLVTILDEKVDTLRKDSKAQLSAKRQKRLSALLAENKRRALTHPEERELDRKSVV